MNRSFNRRITCFRGGAAIASEREEIAMSIKYSVKKSKRFGSRRESIKTISEIQDPKLVFRLHIC
jgi:transposase-like protein